MRLHITWHVKKSVIVDKIIIFFICFIPKFIIALNSIMINTISDEVSAISVAAFLAGYDWRDVVSNAGYYGIGYLFLFSPLFKFGIPAMSIYRIILSVNAVLIGFTGVICYSILNQFFKMESRIAKIIIASTCGSMSIFSTSITRARNEDIYLLCGWLFAYLILRLIDDTTSKRIRYEGMLLSLLLYMLTIHSRAVTYMIAWILTCGICWFLFHKKLVSKYFWISMTVGFLVIEFLLKMYQQWGWASETVRNASLGETVAASFSKIAIDFTMVKSMIMIILGQCFTAFSLSGGIFVISFVIFALFIVYCIKNKKRLQMKEIYLLILGVLYGLMIWLTICGQSITWGVEVYSQLIKGGLNYAYAYKAFTYMRYMGSYVPVFVMTALVIAWNYWDIWEKARIQTMVVFCGLLLFWINIILPYVRETKDNMEFFIAIVLLPSETQNNLEIWYKMFQILFVIALIWMFCRHRKAFVINLLLLGIVFTGYERMEIFENNILRNENNILGYVNASCSVMEQLHNNIITDNMDVCVVDARNNTNHQVWYIYQFLNYDLHIIPGSKDDISLTDIIFSYGEITEFLPKEYACFMLDKNEYLYCKNPKYSELIKLMGYEEA